MQALREVRALDLPNGCIGAGAIRNTVWDNLHGFDTSTRQADVDVIYHDPVDISKERDQAIEACLSERLPQLRWEVTNQAGVHLWITKYTGQPARVFHAVENGLASWPETATAVAAYLNVQDEIQVIAPFGLQDLFEMIVRRNPDGVSIEQYQKRIQQKKFQDHWPRVTVIDK